jgi:hypothetical protein
MNPDRGSRNSNRVASSGVSTIRWPSGSVPPSAIGRNTLPPIRIFGIVSVSTTRIHGVHFIEAMYSAAALISSSVIALAAWIICTVFVFRASKLVRRSSLKSVNCCTTYA